MKKNKIFILAFIALILAFSCFTGFVSAPSALAQPFDDLFPPQSSDNVYFYLDFSSCDIPSSVLGESLIVFTGKAYDSIANLYYDTYLRFTFFELSSFSDVYLLSLPKALIIAYDFSDIAVSFVFPELVSYGIPSLEEIEYLDSQDVLIGRPLTVGSNYFEVGLIPSNLNSFVVTFANDFLAIAEEYNSLRDQYNTLDTLYTTLQGQYNSLNTQYSTLQGQYNSLNTQYSTLQGQYEDLENLYEEARDNADHYQGLLREANAEIEELSADNDRLQGIINNLPPTDLAFGWVGSAFATVDNILSIEIIPNLTIGSLVLIPLVLGVLFFVLRLVRGE